MDGQQHAVRQTLSDRSHLAEAGVAESCHVIVLVVTPAADANGVLIAKGPGGRAPPEPDTASKIRGVWRGW
ncbi:MAG: hypothetical protein QOG20_1243 [Pseudonocardiales bacterium]|jgi:hypothetical protein|nr:hypothetical protein [Pseudonocardiales bacterium]